MENKPTGQAPTYDGHRCDWNFLWQHVIGPDGRKRIDIDPTEFVSNRGGWIQPLTGVEVVQRENEKIREQGLELMKLLKDNNVDFDPSMYGSITSKKDTTDSSQVPKKKRGGC